MSDDIAISVSTPEAAAQLREDFDEVVARTNGDLMSYAMQPDDPISVECAVAFAEQCIERHLSQFAEDSALQSLAPELKRRFREGIERQANAAAHR
jgi:hypothetical protein